MVKHFFIYITDAGDLDLVEEEKNKYFFNVGCLSVSFTVGIVGQRFCSS